MRIGRVPDLYRGATWDRVRAPAIKEWTIALAARTKKADEPGPANFALLGHGLLVFGPVGTGKSSAAALICREAALQGRTVRWSYVPDLCDKIAQTAKERTHESRMQEAVDLLVWDDFGVRDLADWEVGYLDQMVEARYRSRKPMVITTNWTAADLRDDARLARMVDRWRERVCSWSAVLAGASMRR